MSIEFVLPILKTGLIGLAFLLAFFSYRIIAKEQQKKSPIEAILKSAQRYFYLCIILAFVVGSFELGKIVLRSIDKEEVAACRESLDLLESRKNRSTSVADLTVAINEHIAKCGQMIVRLDEEM